MKTPRLVLIDLDGTLVDSVPDIAYCIDQTMIQLGLPERGEQAVRCWVGNGVENLVKRALSNQMDGVVDEALFKPALAIFWDLYSANICVRSLLYDGVIEGLDYLSGRGYKIGCVTNKARSFTLPLLEQLQISQYFEVTVCGDDTARKKPDPLPLLTAARLLHSRPEQSLMLGDSRSDVEAARAAGFQIICMSYGYNHGENIDSYTPDAVIDSMVELKALI
ncbi:MAG: phosphoglycolate phosphatase [Gammaproteobacteria bacterium]|nr:phosphoglycolate phosphatase [Gammaproteobacteria bacterium]